MKFYSHTIRRCFGNGMEAYLLPRPGLAVELECYIRTGSIHEGEFLGCGVSHFLEHMLFQGCAGYPEQQAAEAMRRIGASINACTGHEYTMVNVKAPSCHLDKVAEVVAAMVRSPELPEAKFELEKQVILRESDRTRDQVTTRLTDEVLRTLFPVHPLRHPICGYPELIAACRCDMLKKYHAARYNPERCFWVLTGGFDPDAATEILEKHCGNWKRGTLAETALPLDPPPRSPRSGEIVFPDPLARLALAIRLPDDSRTLDAADLIFGALGMGESSRLVRKLELDERLAQEIGASCFSLCGANLGMISAALTPARMGRLEKRIFEELEKVRRGDLSHAAIEREKMQKYAQLLGQTEDLRLVARNIGAAVLAGESPAECDRRVDRLAGLTEEEIRQVAEKILEHDGISVIRQRPAGNTHRHGHVQSRHTDLELVAPGVLLAADRTVPLAHLELVMPGGTLFEKYPGASALCSTCLPSGTGRFTEAAFWEKLESYGADLNIASGANSFTLSLRAPHRNFSRAVLLLNGMLRTPRFGRIEFDRERDHLIESSRCRDNSPGQAALAKALRALFGAHPYGRSRGGDEAELRKLTREQVKNFYESMLRRDRIVTAFGGGCTPAEAVMLRNELLGGISWAPRDPELPEEPRFPERPRRIDLELPREQTAVVLALPGVRLGGGDDRKIEIVQFCENDLASHLFRRVREDNALAYSVGMAMHGGFHRGSFLFYALTDGKGAQPALKLLREEVERLAGAGVAEGEFLTAREAAAFEADSALESAGAVIAGAALEHYYGASPEQFLRRGSDIRAVTPAEFNAELKQVFANALEHSVAVVVHGTGTGDR